MNLSVSPYVSKRISSMLEPYYSIIAKTDLRIILPQ
jgi:hypothetical protein